MRTDPALLRPPNFYAHCGLDRAERQRREAGWLESCLAAEGTRFLPVWRSRSFIAPEAPESASLPRAAFLTGGEARPLLAAGWEAVLLGLDAAGRAYVALGPSALGAPEEPPPLAGRGQFADLRAFGPLLPREEGALLAYARGLLTWHERHRFCGLCGSPTESRYGGHQRHCSRADCGSPHFPRTDPAVIMLVHDGGEQCLLGRQKIWPPGMHSTLAGFVEPGESLEEAVAREVKEEVGIEVLSVEYHSSQPWPFPSSLMLGFYARAAEAGALRVDPDELESARWFTRAELLASPEDETFRQPRADSIARRLIEDWLMERF